MVRTPLRSAGKPHRYLAFPSLSMSYSFEVVFRISGKALAWIMAGLVLGLCFLTLELFAPRAAFIHVGAVLGSIMVGNVFFGIIPAQKAFVAAVQAGNEPDLDRAEKAKQRSFFNNYFTLPVLFCMVSLHFSAIYQHDMAAIGLFLVMLAGAVGRHFFNLRNIGIVQPIYLIVAAGSSPRSRCSFNRIRARCQVRGWTSKRWKALDPGQAASQQNRDQRARFQWRSKRTKRRLCRAAKSPRVREPAGRTDLR